MTCLDVLVRNVLMFQPVMYRVPVKGNITTEMTSAGGCAMSRCAPAQETGEEPPQPPALYKHCDARTPGEG